jgi:hypothetical protein
MSDFTLNFGPFSSTEAELVAVSERGKARMAEEFGYGAVSCKIRKSVAPMIEADLIRAGYTVDAG